MIDKETYTEEHIEKKAKELKVDKKILCRSIYALSLLEALQESELDFVFKGGTSLLLLLNRINRLSTDIDILVKPGTKVEEYLEKASKTPPFKGYYKLNGQTDKKMRLDHYKFNYYSPIEHKDMPVLLDVLYEKDCYLEKEEKEIKTNFLITKEPYLKVKLPSINCILGDKLTAFAPHTIGVSIEGDKRNKELEIIKQMYDVSTLIEEFNNFEITKKTYMEIAKNELNYRQANYDYWQALSDTINTSLTIITKGKIETKPEEYKILENGINELNNHIINEKYTNDKASIQACSVLYLATCIYNNEPFTKIENESIYINKNINNDKYSCLSYFKKINPKAYGYIIKTIEIEDNHKV